MRLIRLTQDYIITTFDCGDDDLNAFLVEDAKGAIEKRVAKTLIIEDEGKIVAYCSLLNDRISRQDVTQQLEEDSRTISFQQAVPQLPMRQNW